MSKKNVDYLHPLFFFCVSELCYCHEAQNVIRVANKSSWAHFNVKLHFLIFILPTPDSSKSARRQFEYLIIASAQCLFVFHYRTGEKHVFQSPQAACHFGGCVQDYFGWNVNLKQFDIEVQKQHCVFIFLLSIECTAKIPRPQYSCLTEVGGSHLITL